MGKKARSAEWIQIIAFALVLFSMWVIDGYISSLREKLRSRNQELQKAIGAARYRPTEDMDTTLPRGDRTLYAANANGRNRVETEKNQTAVR